MILVDTSVWLRALGGKAPFKKHLSELVLAGEGLGHELVYGELLIGDNGGRTKLLTDYATLAYAPVVNHLEVADLVRARELFGRGLSWTDAHLLASAIVARALLYTSDVALLEAAGEAGVLYQPE